MQKEELKSKILAMWDAAPADVKEECEVLEKADKARYEEEIRAYQAAKNAMDSMTTAKKAKA